MKGNRLLRIENACLSITGVTLIFFPLALCLGPMGIDLAEHIFANPNITVNYFLALSGVILIYASLFLSLLFPPPRITHKIFEVLSFFGIILLIYEIILLSFEIIYFETLIGFCNSIPMYYNEFNSNGFSIVVIVGINILSFLTLKAIKLYPTLKKWVLYNWFNRKNLT